VVYYIGILDGSKDVWGVSIPDVPGCHGGGATPEDAIADAIGALREVAAHWASKGVALDPPRTVQEIIREERLEPLESFVMLPLLLDQARSVKANISLDAGLLEAIDEEAELHGLTRSSFLASAARDKIVHRTVVSEEKKKAASGTTTHRSSKGTMAYAVRDKKGQFKDIHKRSHSADIKRKSKKEK